MGRALILIESLAAALLLVALVAAWAARRPSGLGRWGVPVAVVLVVAVPAAVTAYGLRFLNRMGTVSLTALAAAVVWTLAFLRRVVRRHLLGAAGGPTRRPGRGRSGRWPWRSPPRPS